MNKKTLRMALLVLLIVVASPFLVMAIYVDDWSRDLSNNTAATAPDHADERLRPLKTKGTVAKTEEAIRAFCERHTAWTLVAEKPLPADSPVASYSQAAASDTHHLTHATGLLRFTDDVWVVVEPHAELQDAGVMIHAESRSRIGKGDLGQNPRNLRELLGGLRDAI